jgi:hypothetical protein
MAEPQPPHLSDEEVRERVARLDGLLDQLEQASGSTAETGLQALEVMLAVYGAALARVMAAVADAPAIADALAGDGVVSHLLELHGLGPAADRRPLTILPVMRSESAEVALR